MIAGHETFSKAPIDEALFDLRVEREGSVTVAVLESFLETVKAEFPNRQPRIEIEGRLAVNVDGVQDVQTERRHTGWILKSSDGRNVIQPRIDGLTVSLLRPYSRWEDLRDLSRRLWDLYVERTAPVGVSRLAVRYINRILIPETTFEFGDWFTTGPMFGSDVPQEFSDLFMRVAVRDAKANEVVVITQVAQPRDDLGRTPIVLDIDASVPVSHAPKDAEIWTKFEKLRDLKNRVFFGSVTAKAKELFR